MPLFLVVPLVLCAGVLLLSGLAKVRDAQATRDAFVALRLPRALANSPAPALLPWAEVALGAWLLLASGWALVLGGLATLVLFAGYLVVIWRALGFEERVSCNCFGALGDHDVSRRTLIRNVLLVTAAALATAAPVWGVSVPGALGAEPGPTLGWVAMAALAGAVTLFVLGRSATPAAGGTLGAGSPLPWATLVDAAGAEYRLRSLPDDRTLLLFVSLGCGSCQRLLDDLDAMRAAAPDVAIRVVVSDRVHEGLQTWEPASARTGALLDPHGNVTAFVTEWTPTALLVDRSGVLLADRAIGEDAVRALVASVSVARDGTPAPADADPAPDAPAAEPGPDPLPEPAEEPVDDGLDYERAPIPQVTVLDADGEPRTLHELARTTAALLVSINCLCGTSREAAASVEAWRRRLPSLEVRLLSSVRPESLPAELRPDGALAYDHAGLAQKALGINHSPMAVLLGADGLLAGGPVQGVEAIDAFVADIAEQLAVG